MLLPFVVEEALAAGRRAGAATLENWIRSSVSAIAAQHRGSVKDAGGSLEVEAVEFGIVDQFAEEVAAPAAFVRVVWTGREFSSTGLPAETLEQFIAAELAKVVEEDQDGFSYWAAKLGIQFGRSVIGPNLRRFSQRMEAFRRQAVPDAVARITGAAAAMPMIDLGSFSVIPAELRRLRLEAGWSQEDLASAADVGVSTISRHESGRKAVSGRTLELYAGALAEKLNRRRADVIRDLTGETYWGK